MQIHIYKYLSNPLETMCEGGMIISFAIKNISLTS